MEEKILVLDFGGQYNRLIVPKVRRLQVCTPIRPYHKITPQKTQSAGYRLCCI